MATSNAGKTKAPPNSRFVPFLPRLELPREDADALAREAQTIVHAAVDEYHYYRTGAADWSTWKEVRRVDTLRVFRERQSITKNDIDSSGAPLLPEVLVIGNVSGSLDDMMYGAMASTATAMLANSKCTDEGLSEARVLATLVAPTAQEPFRSLSAKWFSFSLGSGICSLRDCTVLESTGTTTLANGERLGYVVRHSVAFRGVPELQPFGVLRANIASWAIYRESGPGMVQCFVKSFHDLGVGTWRSIGLKSICDRAVALCRLGACAETKRLARLLRSDAWDLLSNRTTRLSGDTECAVCLAQLTSSLLRSSSTRQCKICRRAVCPHCLHKKTVHVADEDAQRVATHQLRVCATCGDDAQRATSTHLQVEEILATPPVPVTKSAPQLSLTDSDGSTEEYF